MTKLKTLYRYSYTRKKWVVVRAISEGEIRARRDGGEPKNALEALARGYRQWPVNSWEARGFGPLEVSQQTLAYMQQFGVAAGGIGIHCRPRTPQ